MDAEEFEQEVRRIKAIPDPYERMQEVLKVQDVIRKDIGELAVMKREVIQEMLASGLTQAEIAKRLGISRARVSQLVKEGKPPQT